MRSHNKVSKFRRYLPQIIAVGVKNGLLLIYGLSLGMPTILIPNLSSDNPKETILLDEEGISWVGSINFLSVPLGCLVSGIATRPFGRIRTLQGISLIFFGSFLLFYFASKTIHILLGLLLTGFSGGLLEAPTLIYTVEITEPNLRGSMCSTSTLAIVIGLLLSFVIGTLYTWRTLALVNACIPLAFLLLLFALPESPYWLISKNKLDKARKNLAWLRGWTKIEAIEQEFQKICKEVDQHKANEFKTISLQAVKPFLKSTFIKPFLLIALTFVLAHFGTSQNVIYSVKIFEVLKAPINSYYATICAGVAGLIGCILLMILVRFLGKRILMFIAQVGIFLNFFLLATYVYYLDVQNLDDLEDFDPSIASKFSWVPLVTILSEIFFAYLLTYTLPWIIMGELYPNEIRDISSGLSAGIGYIIGFLANKTFLDLVSLITLAGTFWIYSIVGFMGLVLMYYFLPETEGKPLSEVLEHYRGGVKLDNNVRKSNKSEVCNGIVNKGFDSYDISDTKF
ncbi:facilitated trehalose transporter Tret1-like [Anthonomus grandis grandis]|uniref:facilitated trehalose transporter Tret1-like n=1 Tax=Anthonomus grandis grandis TaxID=2921223 RepID=UPI002166268A|nr:facilitated trehalose transporter Tret1-like [Anthonomus grandis grandis]XP_050307281.1 facilitated trehalose transporter Tret1-like [Anthonomus grandis grandis]